MAKEYVIATSDLNNMIQELFEDVNKFKEKYPDEPIIFDVDEISRASIEYFWLTGGTSSYIGKCQKNAPTTKTMTDKDYSIIIVEDTWKNMTLSGKKALLMHELLHVVELDEDKWKVREHSLEEFPDTIKLYGRWRNEIVEIEEALKFRRKNER